MSGIVGKIFNPGFYQQALVNLSQRAHAHYHPMIRANSMTPLWHGMLGISAIMYTGTYYARTYPLKQEERAVKRQAMAEYYEKHGGSAHH